LSWVVGSQTVVRPDMPVMREQKAEQRKLVTILRTPEGV